MEEPTVDAAREWRTKLVLFEGWLGTCHLVSWPYSKLRFGDRLADLVEKIGGDLDDDMSGACALVLTQLLVAAPDHFPRVRKLLAFGHPEGIVGLRGIQPEGQG